jgi:hypothetical protein
MMKSLLVTAMVFGLASSACSIGASGSAFGTLTTASPMGRGRASFGAGIGLADATSFSGVLSYGLSQYMDGRVKLGLVDADGGDTKFALGADIKWQFWNIGPETDHPFDFAAGGFLEYTSFDFWSVFQLGGRLIASYPIHLEKGGPLVPYGAINARIESVSFDGVTGAVGTIGSDGSDSNLEVGLTAGVQWNWTPNVSIFGELQFDGNDGLFLGVDFGIM